MKIKLLRNEISTILRILFLFVIQVNLLNLGDIYAHKKFNPSAFKMENKVLVGEVRFKIIPLREYILKAGVSGLIELEVPYQDAFYEMGKRLGGIDIKRLELDQELMDLSESLMKEKDIPQWHLQRRSRIEQLENQLTKIEGERSLTRQMLDNPEKYEKIFKGLGAVDNNQKMELESYLESLFIHEKQIKEILSYANSERKKELELGQIIKKFELRKMQFDQRIYQSYLTLPFSGEVEFLFPYLEGEENYIQAGMDVAVVRDMRELHGHVPILDPEWRLFDENLLELVVKTRKGRVVGKYSRSFSQNISSKDELIYSFTFDSSDNMSLRAQMGGTTEGFLYHKLSRPAHMVPKFLLVSLDPDTFRNESWKGLVKKICSDYEILEVGLYSIALAKIDEGFSEDKSTK